jgi:amidophosphoribosyltransferase
VRPGRDTLVVLDDSIVRGNTMKNAILPMLDRLGPKRIVIASSAPPIRYPDCYGIDMSTLGELVTFRALVNLLGEDANDILHDALASEAKNPLAPLYTRFTEEQHAAEIARLLTPPGMKAEVKVVYQTVENLRKCLGSMTSDNRQPTSGTTVRQTTSDANAAIGDWYFTGDYPTPGGYKVLHQAILNFLTRTDGRSY